MPTKTRMSNVNCVYQSMSKKEVKEKVKWRKERIQTRRDLEFNSV